MHEESCPKTTNTKYNFALTMEIHVQSSNMWSTLSEEALHKRLFVFTHN
jgi:hypothetical protein